MGIDPSQKMLQLAKERLARYTGIHLVCTTAADLHLDQRFPVVLLPLNTLWHLPDSDAQLRALTVLRRHCQDRSLLVVDCSNPSPWRIAARMGRFGSGLPARPSRARCVR
jgi:SAM-dependent methyltransferase